MDGTGLIAGHPISWAGGQAPSEAEPLVIRGRIQNGAYGSAFGWRADLTEASIYNQARLKRITTTEDTEDTGENETAEIGTIDANTHASLLQSPFDQLVPPTIPGDFSSETYVDFVGTFNGKWINISSGTLCRRVKECPTAPENPTLTTTVFNNTAQALTITLNPDLRDSTPPGTNTCVYDKSLGRQIEPLSTSINIDPSQWVELLTIAPPHTLIRRTIQICGTSCSYAMLSASEADTRCVPAPVKPASVSNSTLKCDAQQKANGNAFSISEVACNLGGRIPDGDGSNRSTRAAIHNCTPFTLYVYGESVAQEWRRPHSPSHPETASFEGAPTPAGVPIAPGAIFYIGSWSSDDGWFSQHNTRGNLRLCTDQTCANSDSPSILATLGWSNEFGSNNSASCNVRPSFAIMTGKECNHGDGSARRNEARFTLRNPR